MHLPWFKSKPRPLVGVDISSSAVKLLDLEQQGGQFILKHFSVVPLPVGAVAEGEICDSVAVSYGVEKAREFSQTPLTEAAGVVLGSSVMIKQVTMSAGLNEADIESTAWVEANKHFPDIINDMNLDFQILGQHANDPQLIDVLLVACRKDKVEQRIEALSEGGFKTQVIDVDYYALERASQLVSNQLINGGDKQTIAFINLGIYNASLIVIKDHQLIYSRSQAFNGKHLIDLLKSKLEIDDWLMSFAERCESLDQNHLKELVDLITPQLVPNIRQLLQFYYSAENQQTVDQVVLSGECAVVPNIAGQLSEQLALPTTVADPFKQMDIQVLSGTPNQIRVTSPAFMVCAGLALRGLSA